ncbi:MAG: hypothetical protein DWI12_02180 [Planctomycetota bacterium]|nr:MAG: hypothetical protein DWI12_02180 [Planctomycetota bacterium]
MPIAIMASLPSAGSARSSTSSMHSSNSSRAFYAFEQQFARRESVQSLGVREIRTEPNKSHFYAAKLLRGVGRGA